MDDLKIAFFSLGHPDLKQGGTETASFNLFQGIRPFVKRAIFVALAPNNSLHKITKYSEDIYFWPGKQKDWFLVSGINHYSNEQIYGALGEHLDIIHIHHLSGFGVETFFQLKLAYPKAKFVFTLHEFLMICPHNGQMVRRDSNLSLCSAASPAACCQCFAEKNIRDFELRKRYLETVLLECDKLIAPSEFLANRFIETVPELDIEVIENAISFEVSRQTNGGLTAGDSIAFGIFGSLNKFKGVDVFLKALGMLTPEVLDKCKFEIFGKILTDEDDPFATTITELHGGLDDRVSLSQFGVYSQAQMPSLLSELDWTIVPSVWWENSPMVIQESLEAGVPVLCSDIGGMSEKVKSGRDGLHFAARNPRSLAKQISEIAISRPKLKPKRSYSNATTFEKHSSLYMEILSPNH